MILRRTRALFDVDFEAARRHGHELEIEGHPADLAPVGGFDLHLPGAGLIVRLETVAAEALGAPAGDLDGNRVLQHPATLFPVPAHAHFVGKAPRRENAEEHEDLVAGLRAELLVAVVPEAPPRPLVAEPVRV